MAPPDADRPTLSLAHPNPSLQVTPDHKLKLVDAPVYAPQHGEVLLHIKATGVCGSDLHFWRTGRIGPLVFETDGILGHEAAGVVLRCGEGVISLQPGDRVAIEPGVPCDECFLCMAGRYNLCEAVAFAGVWPHDGTAQRFKVHPAKWLHKIPPSLPFSSAALLEPLSVVLHALHRAPPTLGRPLLICGAGPIGLIAAAAARASGAHPLVVTDVAGSRLDFARAFVPGCVVYRVDGDKTPEEDAVGIRGLFEEHGVLGGEVGMPDVVLECTGVAGSILTAARVVRRGGTVMVVGVGKAVLDGLPFMHLSLGEIDLKFINRYSDTWPAGISAMMGGILDLNPLITHTFPLEKAVEALELCGDVRNGSIKVQIVDEVDISLE